VDTGQLEIEPVGSDENEEELQDEELDEEQIAK